MSSSNIQKIFNLIKFSLGYLGTNVFIDFKDLNIFSKVFRILSLLNLTFFYFMGVFYTFLYNLKYPEESKINEQLLLFNCIIGVFTTIIRIQLSFSFKNKYFAIFDWIVNVHEQPQNQALQNYVGTKFEKLGLRYVQFWK